ncbi:KilA domain-containing protein [Pseudomonas duriflava]|uniref:KilA domain-containing protein n=1 Tax=Pseudomonas duriflava TaxID=459528 RepID=A0A562QCS7_9PSED|nr:KilA-N domain-containing protein [Pseudomonas duriflava]TWI53826.1 KilA domain-containing protein [Pseudomonas duriflava]
MSEESKTTNEARAVIDTLKAHYKTVIQLQTGNGYVNMTEAANAYGKDIQEFLNLPTTNQHLQTIAKLGPDRTLVETKGNNGKPSAFITWGHPSLAPLLLRWLDPDKAALYDLIMHQILIGSASITLAGQQRDFLKLFHQQ